METKLELENWLLKEANRLVRESITLRDLEILHRLLGSPVPSLSGTFTWKDTPPHIIDDVTSRVGDLTRFGPDESRHAYRYWLKRWTDPYTIKRFADYVPVGRINWIAATLLPEVQERLLNMIVNRGVVIETNPSSNKKMWRYANANKLPIVNLLKRSEQAPRVTVCTDNAGTYDTRAENEYTLLFEALMSPQGGFKRDEALDLLRNMRKCGLEEINWPPNLNTS